MWTLIEIDKSINSNTWKRKLKLWLLLNLCVLKTKMRTWKPIVKIELLCSQNLMIYENYFFNVSLWRVIYCCRFWVWLSVLTSQDVYQMLREFVLWRCYISDLLNPTIITWSHVFFDEFDMFIVIAFQFLLHRIEVNDMNFLVQLYKKIFGELTETLGYFTCLLI